MKNGNDQYPELEFFGSGPSPATFSIVAGSFDSHYGWSNETGFTVSEGGAVTPAAPSLRTRPSRLTVAAPDGNGAWTLNLTALSATTVSFIDGQGSTHTATLPSGPQLSSAGPNPATIQSYAVGCNQTIWLAIVDNSGNSTLYWLGAASGFKAVAVSLPDDGAVQHRGVQSLSVAIVGDHLCYYRHFDSQAQGYTNYFGCIAPAGSVTEKPDAWESPSVYLVTGPDGNAWGINDASGDTGNATILRLDADADSSQFNLPGFYASQGFSDLVSSDGYFWWCDGSFKLWKMTVS